MHHARVAAAKSFQSCPTLYDPTDCSPPGSPVLRILQARSLEWVAISFSNAWKWSHSVMSDSSRPHGLPGSATAAYQAPPSMGFSRQEYWSGVPLPLLMLGLLEYYWLYSQCYSLYPCDFITDHLSVLMLFTRFAHCPTPPPFRQFFLCTCESVPVLLYLFICFLDSTNLFICVFYFVLFIHLFFRFHI